MSTPTAEAVKSPVARLAGALEFLCAQGFAGREFTRAAEPALRRLLMERDFLPEEARRPSEEGYARHLLHRDPAGRFVIAAMVWRPGQGTPVHDHDGSWGMLGMVRGSLEVTNFFPAGGAAAPGEVSLRAEAPHRPRAGAGGCVCGCADVHRVVNTTDELAVSVHVYPRDLEGCRVFEPLDAAGGRYEARVVSLSCAGEGAA